MSSKNMRAVAEEVSACSDPVLIQKIRQLSHEIPLLQSTLALMRRELRRRKRRLGKR